MATMTRRFQTSRFEVRVGYGFQVAWYGNRLLAYVRLWNLTADLQREVLSARIEWRKRPSSSEPGLRGGA